MPPQRQQSDILAKYRDRAQQAHEAHASDETEYSQFGELPDGINGGIAQLVEVKVDACAPRSPRLSVIPRSRRAPGRRSMTTTPGC
jgi:hypothetical protein